MFHPNCEPQKNLDILKSLDWNSDHPYEIAYDDKEGRFLRATKDIQKGELILEESPMVRGPPKRTTPLCLGCFTVFEDASYAIYCPNCNFPFCSEECKVWEEHQMECALFTQQKVKVNADNFNYELFEPDYDLILPLRILSLKQNPEKWAIIMKMCSQVGNLKKNSDWVKKQKYVVDYILNTMKLPDVSEDLLLTVMGIIQINQYEGSFHGYKINLLHPLSSLLSHSCIPNSKRYYSGIEQGNYLNVRAVVDIPKGSKITISYTDSLIPTLIRQKMLKEDYVIDCNCERCKDPTDLGTNGNSVICPKCDADGFAQPNDWKCCKCKTAMDSSEVSDMVTKANKDADSIMNDMYKWTMEDFEGFLTKYAKKLHPDHVLMVKVKSKMAGFYGKVPGYTMVELSQNKELIEKKLKLCQDAMKVLEKIEPGYGSLKGVLMYEHHLAIFLKCQIETDPDWGPSEALKAEMMNSFRYLEACIENMQDEQKGTFECSLVEGAAMGLLKSGYPISQKLFEKMGHLKYSMGF